MIKDIQNFVQLTPLISTAGQPRADQLVQIAEAGYQQLVNLAMPDHPKSLHDEAELVESLGIGYHSIPVPYDNPRTSQLREFCQLMQAIEGQRVFVHCIMNYRVSAFMFHYLNKLRGYSEAAARSPVFDHWQVEPQWQALLELSAEEIGL